MFIVTKILWLLLNPSTLFVLALLYTMLQALRRRWRRVRRWSTGLAAIALFLCFFPVGDWLLYPLETRFVPARDPAAIAGIIVLGGAIDPTLSRAWQTPQVNGNAERLTESVFLLKKYPAIKLYFTGGSGDPLRQDDKEADWARRLLARLGAPMERIEFERDSRNTWENAVNLKALVKPRAEDKYILVTSAAHMPRAVGAFRRAGWTVIAHPVDYSVRPTVNWVLPQSLHAALGRLSAALYEWGGLIVYRLSGRSASILPAP